MARVLSSYSDVYRLAVPEVAEFVVDGDEVTVRSAPGADPARVADFRHDPVEAAVQTSRGLLVLTGDAVLLDDGRAVAVGRPSPTPMPAFAQRLGEVVHRHWVALDHRDGNWSLAGSGGWAGAPLAAIVSVDSRRGPLATAVRGADRLGVVHRLDHAAQFGLRPDTAEAASLAFARKLALARWADVLDVRPAGHDPDAVVAVIRQHLAAP